MTGRDWNAIHPQFALPDDHDVVFEPDAGILLAAEALTAMLALARSLGGDRFVACENSPVRRIDLDADRPTLELDDAIHHGRSPDRGGRPVARDVAPGVRLALRPERQQVLYFDPADPTEYGIGRLPVFISVGAGPRDLYYGMPGVLGSGVKAARHGGDPIPPDDDARHIGEDYRAEVRGFLRGVLPALAEAPIGRTEICKYTVASNEDFLLGPLPRPPDVIVASPCSGHGFKFSALIGRVLADLATSGRTDVPIDWKCS